MHELEGMLLTGWTARCTAACFQHTWLESAALSIKAANGALRVSHLRCKGLAAPIPRRSGTRAWTQMVSVQRVEQASSRCRAGTNPGSMNTDSGGNDAGRLRVKLKRVTAAQPQHLQNCLSDEGLTRTIAIDDLEQRGWRQTPDSLPSAGGHHPRSASTLYQHQAHMRAGRQRCTNVPAVCDVHSKTAGPQIRARRDDVAVDVKHKLVLREKLGLLQQGHQLAGGIHLRQVCYQLRFKRVRGSAQVTQCT